LDSFKQAEFMIALFGMVATVGAAIAAFISARAARKSAEITEGQLSEMIQQRISQARPEILLFNSNVFLKYNTEHGYGEFINNGIPELKIINVGLGHCKVVKIQWILDVEKKVLEIRNFKFGKEKIHKYIKESELHTEHGVTFLDNDLIEYIPVLLKDKDYFTRVPFAYLELLSLSTHLFIDNYLESSFIPSAKVEFEYLDVYKNKFNKSFLITPRIFNQSVSRKDGLISDYLVEIRLQLDEI
jgi:hypothetical protein